PPPGRKSPAGLTGDWTGSPAPEEEEAPPEPAWAPAWLFSAAEEEQAAKGTFIDAYVAYAARRTDAPATFHEALALVGLSAVVGRRACLRMTVGNVYPILWVLILASSSIYRKSTSMDLLRDLLGEVDPDLLTPNDFTPQRFIS